MRPVVHRPAAAERWALRRVEGCTPPRQRRARRTGRGPETLVWMKPGMPVGLSDPTWAPGPLAKADLGFAAKGKLFLQMADWLALQA